MIDFSISIEEFHIPVFRADPEFFRALLKVKPAFLSHLRFGIA